MSLFFGVVRFCSFFSNGRATRRVFTRILKRFRLTYPSEFRVQVWVMVRGSGSRLRSLGRMMVQGVGLLRYCVVGLTSAAGVQCLAHSVPRCGV